MTDYPKCVGCGWCCKKVQCIVSYMKYGKKDVCPDLRQHDGRYWCGIFEDASEGARVQYNDALSIGIGITCLIG